MDKLNYSLIFFTNTDKSKVFQMFFDMACLLCYLVYVDIRVLIVSMLKQLIEGLYYFVSDIRCFACLSIYSMSENSCVCV